MTAALMAEAKKNGWTVVSMRDDWKRVFPFDTMETNLSIDSRFSDQRPHLPRPRESCPMARCACRTPRYIDRR
ncbi:MAG: hypothetical protein DME51_01380 [Verrucomicrobia bacterium]|nr:MAG: hypothetical protein DME51_01380 [Verrucomicrobiota bacterium]